MRLVLVLFLALVAFGCEERYRYPCQDPDNWELKECKKPWCQANGTCPEDLFKYTADGTNPVPGVPPTAAPAPATPAPVAAPPKGDCK